MFETQCYFRASRHEFEITVQTIVKVRAVWHSLRVPELLISGTSG